MGKPKTWNDWLSLVILLGTPVLWVFGNVGDTVMGATIAGWTLVVQFYFRRAPEK